MHNECSRNSIPDAVARLYICHFRQLTSSTHPACALRRLHFSCSPCRPRCPHYCIQFDNWVVFAPWQSQNYHSCQEWLAHNNTLFGPNVVLAGPGCKDGSLTLPEWQARNVSYNDVGSTWSKEVPAAESIMAVARGVLGKW